MTGFFKNPAKHEINQHIERCYIAVGGEQFHALAVAFIDSFKSSTRIDEPSLKKVLERLFAYYPKLVATQPYLTPTDRMQILVNNSRMSELVDCMAHVLRQLTVDEIYTHPLNYRDVFKGMDATTSKNYLRESTTALPAHALSALTQVLAINLTLSLTEHGKELRKRVVYKTNLTGIKQDLVLQVQGSQYFPQVVHRSDFTYVGQLALPSKQAEETSAITQDMAEVLQHISQDNQRIRISFEQSRKTLISMIAAGELTKENLIELFIEFLPVTENTPNNAQFFAELEQLDSHPVSTTSNESLQTESKLLANTLAGWISLGQVDEEQLFDRLETKSSATFSG